MNHQAERRWREAESLAEAGRELSGTFDKDKAIEIICKRARMLTAADGACVILREGEMVHYSREDSVAPLWAGQRFPIGNCISGWSIVHRAAVVIRDISRDPRIPMDYYRPTFVRSLAIMPIAPDQPIGAIGVYWARRHSATPRETELLELLAGMASTSFVNIELFDKMRDARREAERKAEELERAIKLKDEFLATVSHELRTPLNTVLGWAQILLSQQLQPEQAAKAVNAIFVSAKKQASVVDDLLDATSILNGTAKLHRSPMTVGPEIRAAVDKLQPAASKGGVSIYAEINDGDAVISADGERLQQVVRNLLSNAIKFTHEGGRVLVVSDRVDSCVQITVADTGMGIAPDFLPHVFDRFRQADGSSTRCFGGLGLGLSIVKEIVEMHGGSVEAQSAGEGLGATFRIRIPLATGSATASSLLKSA